MDQGGKSTSSEPTVSEDYNADQHLASAPIHNLAFAPLRGMTRIARHLLT